MIEQRDRLNRRLKELIGNGLASCLREMGFRKAGFVFRRVLPDAGVAQVIQVQRSQYVEPDESVFTVNGGVYVFCLAFVKYGVEEKGKPDEPSCPIRIRPGALEDNLDVWWQFREATPADEMGEISDNVRRRAGEVMGAWLNGFTSPLDVAEHLIAEEKGPGRTRIGYRDPPQVFHDCINAAGCFLLAGDPENALKWSDLAVKGARLPEGVEMMTRARDRIHRLVREGWTPPDPQAA